jgi:putative tryptophan/tyrosine transport system substrate-binding protein
MSTMPTCGATGRRVIVPRTAQVVRPSARCARCLGMYDGGTACYKTRNIFNSFGAAKHMRRRDFVMFASAAALPLPAIAQPTIPVIGVLSNTTPGPEDERLTTALRRGLNEGGYVEGRNVAIEYRWSRTRRDELPGLLADLIRRQVSLIVAKGGLVTALPAKAATNTIPVLFVDPYDPVKVGLVASLNRPGGNATGVSMYTTDIAQKRLDLLHSLVPKAAIIGVLINPTGAVSKIEIEDLREAARALGLKLLVLEAAAESDLELAFASASQGGAGALLLSAHPFFWTRRTRIVALAARYGLPAVYPWPEYAEAGGLMSYGPTLTWAYQQLGLYASRILKGTKPSDLPVQLPTAFQLVLNLKTAKSLGLTVPWVIIPDQVIE